MKFTVFTGKQLRELIDTYISDEDIVCFGEKGDEMGRYDRQILGVEKRYAGFEIDDVPYKAIVTAPFSSMGTLKFWK